MEIVNLGEEIVRIYESFVSWADPNFPRLPKDATPRDRALGIARTAVEATANASWEITALMEVADYSLHPITINDYAAMYLTTISLGVKIPSGEPGAE